jgi:hypothetical protein
VRRRLALVAVVLAALLPAPPASAAGPAGVFAFGRFSGGDAAVAGGVFGGLALGFGAAGEAERGRGWRDDPALLIVDASPHDAEVYLDGRRLGAAGELVALVLPLAHGAHTVQVVAPGHRPWARQFVADGAFPIRIRATLTRAAP